MSSKLVPVFQEEFERLLSDGPVRHEADDTHAGRRQEVHHLALVGVVCRQSDLPGMITEFLSKVFYSFYATPYKPTN